MKRSLVRYALLASLAAPLPSRACDDMLQALIMGKETRGEFDHLIEQISTQLQRGVQEAKIGAWRGADEAYRNALMEWLKIYQRYLTSPPEGFADLKDWPAMLAGYSARFKALGEIVAARKYEPLHDDVLAIHASLMQLYVASSAKSRAQAVTAMIEPLTLLRAMGGDVIERGDPLKVKLESVKVRLASLVPLVIDPDQKTRVTEIETRLTSLLEKHDKLDAAALKAEVDQLHAVALEFKERFAAGTSAPAATRN